MNVSDDPVDASAQYVVKRGRHLEMLIVCSIAIVISFLLQVDGSGETVQVKGLSSIPIPGTCLSREWFGIQCPGCGLTRSFVHLAHFDFWASFSMHRLGWLLFICTVVQIPYRLHALRNQNRALLPVYVAKWIGNTLVFLLIANWALGQLWIPGLEGN